MYFGFPLFLSLCLLCCFSALSQEKERELILLAEAADAFNLSFKNADSAMLLAGKILTEAKEQNSKEAVAGAYNAIGWAFMHKGHLDSSVVYLQKSLQGYRDIQSDKDIVRLSINLGEVFTKKSQYVAALHHLLEGDSLSVALNDVSLQTDIKRQLAIVYRNSGDDLQSSRYFQQALAGFEQMGDYFRYINTSVSLSILYRKMALPDSSLFVLERSLALVKKHDGTLYQEAMIEENMGETYFSKQQFAKALLHFQKAYRSFQQLGNQADLAYEALSIGKTFVALHRYAEAETYLMRSYTINESLKMINYQYDASHELASLYERRGDWKNAHYYLRQANTLKDSLDLSAQMEKIAGMKAVYESEKQEREMALLKTKHELTQSRATRATLLQYVFILLFIVAAAIAWLLAYRIKIKNKKEQIKEQERIAHELEDERILNLFAVSLYGRNTVDDILWDIANNCFLLMHFEDCVVYKLDKNRNVLIQAAAAGPKKIEDNRAIYNPIEIPLGRGIVGSVAITGKSEIIADTCKDERYIRDDASRASEITVPIFVDGKVFGVIDSEDVKQNFYTKRHLALLQKVAAVCSERLVKLLAEEKLRNIIAQDLHDEMGSTLTSIHILSNLAMKKDSGSEVVYLGKIKEYANLMMESMSDIVWAVNPQHDTVERLLLRMKEFSVELLEPAGITVFFEVGDLHDMPGLKSEERKFLYLIFKEALNNIVKYSKATTVSITLSRTQHSFIMSIADNGIGFNIEAVRAGNGLKNMQVRADAIGAAFTIRPIPGEGTTILLEKDITS